MTKIKTIINISLIVGLLLPGFCFAQEDAVAMPQTIEEAKGFGLNILKALPDATKKVWQEEAWPFILQMWGWAQDMWNTYLGHYVEDWWNKVLNWTGKEPANLQTEFQKERQEMEKDTWERFKDLF